MLWLQIIYSDLANLFGEGRGMAGLIFLMSMVFWALVIERYWYFYLRYPRMRDEALRRWRYAVKNPLHGRLSRRRILREMSLKTRRTLGLISDLLGIIPLLGLLGLVGGLIQVLNILASPGGVNATTLIRGISAASVPMVAALSVVIAGVYFKHALRIRAVREIRLLGDQLRHG